MQTLRTQPETVERSRNQLHEVMGEQLTNGHVHRDRYGRTHQTAVMPLGELRHGVLEDALTERMDHAAAFGQLDEVERGNHTTCRVDPSGEGFERHQTTTGDVDDRLEPGDEFPGDEPALEILEQRKPAEDLVLHLVAEHLDTVASTALGPVHGDVRLAEQRRCVDRLVVVGIADHHTDRSAHRHLLSGDLNRFAKSLEDPAGNGAGMKRVGRGLRHHDELISAEARYRVRIAKRLLEASGHDAEEIVAGAVAQRVVHVLEAVQIDQHDRDVLTGAHAAGQCQFDAVEQKRPVRESGEGIMERLMGECTLGVPTPDGVGEHVPDPGEDAVVLMGEALGRIGRIEREHTDEIAGEAQGYEEKSFDRCCVDDVDRLQKSIERTGGRGVDDGTGEEVGSERTHGGERKIGQVAHERLAARALVVGHEEAHELVGRPQDGPPEPGVPTEIIKCLVQVTLGVVDGAVGEARRRVGEQRPIGRCRRSLSLRIAEGIDIAHDHHDALDGCVGQFVHDFDLDVVHIRFARHHAAIDPEPLEVGVRHALHIGDDRSTIVFVEKYPGGSADEFVGGHPGEA